MFSNVEEAERKGGNRKICLNLSYEKNELCQKRSGSELYTILISDLIARTCRKVSVCLGISDF